MNGVAWALGGVAVLATARLVRRRGSGSVEDIQATAEAIRALLDADAHVSAYAPYGGLLGCGADRCVVPLGADRVLKVARSGDGEDANLHEMAIWIRYGRRFRHLLVPCRDVDGDGLWLVMDRARPLRQRTFVEQGEAVPIEQLGAAYQLDEELTDGEEGGLLDLNVYNWGVHDETIKLLDYGVAPWG